jgi:hypothetical protein
MSSGRLALGFVGGVVVLIVALASGSVLGALLGVVGLLVAAAALVVGFRRAGTLGRFALSAVAGILAALAGLGLGIVSYDERYFGDQSSRAFWDAVALAGAALLGLGLLLAGASVVGVVVVAIARSLRRG